MDFVDAFREIFAYPGMQYGGWLSGAAPYRELIRCRRTSNHAPRHKFISLLSIS